MDDLGIELPEDEGGAPVEGGGYADDEFVDEPDYIDELERLAGLRDRGIVSDDEFNAKKQQLLGL